MSLISAGKAITSGALNNLKWKDPSGEDQVFKLKEEMSAEWEKIGRTLGFSDAKLKGFKKSQMNESEACMNDVIRVWIQKMSVEVGTCLRYQ